MMILDSISEYYHIRDADNRLRVVISEKPKVNCYVGYEMLVDNEWKHIEGTAVGCGNKYEAMRVAESRYENWKQNLSTPTLDTIGLKK